MAVQQQQAPARQRPPFSLDTFLKKMQAQVYRVDAPQKYTDGGRTRFILPNTGAASKLMVSISGSIQVGGTITSGRFQGWPYPAPFSILKNLRLTSNQNLSLIDISGWGWYKWICQRYGIDPCAVSARSYSSHYNTLLGIGAQSIQPGANVAAQTYPVNITLPIPIAYNDELLTGLLALQSNSIQYPLEFTWGNITGGISGTGGTNDLFNGLIGSGITITADLTVTVGAEIIKIPRDYPPVTSMFMSVSESVYSPLIAGTNVIRPAVNDLYTMFIAEFTNNSTPVDPKTIQNATFMYSGNNRRFDEDITTQAGFNFFKSGLQPIDGTLTWDLGARRGQVDRRDLYDAFNDAQVTDLQLRVDLPQSATISGVNQCTLVTEALRFVKQR